MEAAVWLVGMVDVACGNGVWGNEVNRRDIDGNEGEYFGGGGGDGGGGDGGVGDGGVAGSVDEAAVETTLKLLQTQPQLPRALNLCWVHAAR